MQQNINNVDSISRETNRYLRILFNGGNGASSFMHCGYVGDGTHQMSHVGISIIILAARTSMLR